MVRHSDRELAEFAGTLKSVLSGQVIGEPDASQVALTRAALDLLWLVLDKNEAYGDSMRSPVECFARGVSPADRIGVRMDDKINRLIKGKGREALGEDSVVDLAGYLIGLLSLEGPSWVWEGDQ